MLTSTWVFLNRSNFSKLVSCTEYYRDIIISSIDQSAVMHIWYWVKLKYWVSYGNKNIWTSIRSSRIQWLRRGFGLVNQFIGSTLVVTTFSSYTLKITVTVAHVTPHTKSSNSSSGHTAVPLDLLNSSEVNSHSRILSYPLGTDHA
jgi:hypothetical protein